ncbi:hypothetical protein [Pectobacterium punjabense]|uniref:hypothetical protein n=1 Tax=Pectobacterium punjabense TaxID=2108399 RepID=UPI003819832A
MMWQGIPFPFTGNHEFNNSLFTLSKLSELTVNTSFGWDNFWGTIAGAIVGAAIPAGIAFYTIRQNNKSSEAQRAQQIKDLEAARETQLKISTKSFNAQVLSSNRQLWINGLRTLLVEFCSLCELLIYFRRSFGDEPKMPSGRLISERGQVYYDGLLKSRNDLRKLYFEVKLMLNASEFTSKGMLSGMEKMMRFSEERELSSFPVFINVTHPELEQLESRFLKVCQRCLKNEWKRVKSGS